MNAIKTMQYKGETFNGKATVEIKEFDNYFMIYVEQVELDEDQSETHLFGYEVATEQEAKEIFENLTSKDFIEENEMENMGFQYF